MFVIVFHSGYDHSPAGFGVLTFFVISGFLITHLLLRERESTGTISFKNFYARRSLRIFPAFYVYWVVAVAVLLHHGRIIREQAVCALLYVNNYYQGLHGYPSTIFSHTWSLGVEEQFYLLWPAVFFVFRNRLRRLVGILLFVIPALWVYRDFLYFRGAADAYIYTSLETRIDAILVGCLVAILLHLDLASRLLEEVRKPLYLPITVGALFVSLFCFIVIGPGYRDLIGFALDPILVIALILQLISSKRAAWMDARPISYLGKISYSTYLYQQIAIPLVKKVVHHHQPIISLLCVLMAWVIAAVSYEIVERPFMRMKYLFVSGRSVRTPATVVN